jgi:transcriptional regulator of arginine metabolism
MTPIQDKLTQRRDLLKTLVRTGNVRTQQDMIAGLAKRGIEATQATISRDIHELGLVKLNSGAYILPEDQHLARMSSDLLLDVIACNNQALAKTTPGTASGVAAAIDAAALPGVLGTIAGDDTILALCNTAAEAKDFAATLMRIKAIGC